MSTNSNIIRWHVVVKLVMIGFIGVMIFAIGGLI